jgi:4-diphosphocytidyl-2C-methyl-D-erythritol kinase
MTAVAVASEPATRCRSLNVVTASRASGSGAVVWFEIDEQVRAEDAGQSQANT